VSPRSPWLVSTKSTFPLIDPSCRDGSDTRNARRARPRFGRARATGAATSPSRRPGSGRPAACPPPQRRQPHLSTLIQPPAIDNLRYLRHPISIFVAPVDGLSRHSSPGWRGLAPSPAMAPLDWLRTFLTVYRVGSIPGAAPRLDLTQPAVSQQIKALETRFRPRRRVARRPRRGRARGTPPPGGARLERGRGGRRLLLERLGDLRLAVVDGEEEEAHREGSLGRR